MVKPAQSLQSMIDSALTAVGYELVGSELLRQGRHSLLRIYIDKEGGINADDCAKASRQIAAVLDVEDPITGAYVLEVSSPGLDRPLYTEAHYQRFVGQMIKFRLRVPVNNQRQFSGVLSKVDEGRITVEVGKEIMSFELVEIEKANLVPNLAIGHK